jgi:hypothetical protein
MLDLDVKSISMLLRKRAAGADWRRMPGAESALDLLTLGEEWIDRKKKHLSFSILNLSFVIGRYRIDRVFFNDK